MEELVNASWMDTSTTCTAIFIGHGCYDSCTVEQNATGYHIVGALMVWNFKHLIKSDQIGNCPVTAEDIEIAENIHRKDISHMKGKTTKRNPTTTTTTLIDTPKELKEHNENATSHINMMCINEIGFMTSTSHPMHCCSCEHVANNAKESFCNALNKMS